MVPLKAERRQNVGGVLELLEKDWRSGENDDHHNHDNHDVYHDDLISDDDYMGGIFELS